MYTECVCACVYMCVCVCVCVCMRVCVYTPHIYMHVASCLKRRFGYKI